VFAPEGSPRLLLPVDGGEASMQAVRLVAGWRPAPARPAPLLLNVQPPPLKAWPASGFDEAVLEEALRQEGSARLRDAGALLDGVGFARVPALVRLGHAADTIDLVAREEGAHAVVMGTRGHGPLSGFALGSVALRVVQARQRPVVLVKAGARLPQALGRHLRVLVPLDGSDSALRALRHLVAWAQALGRLQVELVHFQAPLAYLDTVMPPHDDVLRQWSGEACDRALAAGAACLSEAGIEHREHRLTGDPGAGIAAFVPQCGAELVAMSAHGIGTLRHLVVGSVALKTAHASPVPVAFLPGEG
jgi:nucleotide-binding universal stress UspA family protein